MSSNAVAWGPIRVQTPLQPAQHSGRTRATVPQMARDQHGPRFPCGFLRESCLVKLKPEAEVPLPLPSACEVPWGQKELQHQSLLMASAPDQFLLINKGTPGRAHTTNHIPLWKDKYLVTLAVLGHSVEMGRGLSSAGLVALTCRPCHLSG